MPEEVSYRTFPPVQNIAHEDPELFTWMQNVTAMGGGHFLSHMVHAAFHADGGNTTIIYPVLKQLQAKYPKYNNAR